jgi:competence protein ComEC
MTVLDVGQGSSTLLRFPDGRTLLYDAGTKGGFDVGGWVIAPHLWEKGLRRIDLLALSHADADHINAVDSLLDRFEIGAAVVPAGFSKRIEGARLVERMRAAGIPTRFLYRGSAPPLGFDDVLEVLHPPLPGPGIPLLSTNNASLVLAVSVAGRRVLLPGDLELPGLSMLTADEKGRDFDVVLAPHHGSNEPEGNAPLARAAPAVVAMSCGWSFGVEGTAALYRAHGASVYRTCEDGAVSVTISPTGAIRVRAFRHREEDKDEETVEGNSLE